MFTGSMILKNSKEIDVMMLWECKVMINGVPTVMTTKANDLITAKGYFVAFGKLLNEPRIIQ